MSDIETIIRMAMPAEFLLDPPDGGEVRTIEGVRRMADTITALRAENENWKLDFAGMQRAAVFDAEEKAALRAEVERLKQREKDLTLEGLSHIGRLEQVREVLAGTDADSLPRDYPTLKMAHDRMGDLMKARAEVERLKTDLATEVRFREAAQRDMKAMLAEIEMLQKQLRFAAGYISGTDRFSSWHPEKVLEWIETAALEDNAE